MTILVSGKGEGLSEIGKLASFAYGGSSFLVRMVEKDLAMYRRLDDGFKKEDAGTARKQEGA